MRQHIPRSPVDGEWLLVRESLVRASLVVETHVLGNDASKVFLAEDEDVIEQLSSERAGQALSEGIHVRRAYRGAHDSRPGRLEYDASWRRGSGRAAQGRRCELAIAYLLR